MTDLYALLGVERGADAATLKRAWRRLAMLHHPDRNPDDPDAVGRLAAINAAYDVLSDPERRALYDRYGADAASVFFDPARAEPPPSTGPRGIRTGPIRAKPTVHGADANVVLLLSARQAEAGGAFEVEVEPDRPCTACDGTGLRRSGRLCSKCERGWIRGLGRYRVMVPRGVRSGQLLRVPGRGHKGTGRGARPGDLLVTVEVEPVYRTEGLDRVLVWGVEKTRLDEGGVVEIPPPVGDPIQVRLRAGTRPGQRIRLRGKAENGRDLVVELTVLPETPITVDAVRLG